MENTAKDKNPITTDFQDLYQKRPRLDRHPETHQGAMKRLKLQVGDTVKVLRKFDNCCDLRWCDRMDKFIGKNFEVEYFFDMNKYIALRFNNEDYFFPAYVLEVVSRANESKEPEIVPNITPLRTKPFDIHEAIDNPENVVYDNKKKPIDWKYSNKIISYTDTDKVGVAFPISDPLLRLIDDRPVVEEFINVWGHNHKKIDQVKENGIATKATAILKLIYQGSELIGTEIVHRYKSDK